MTRSLPSVLVLGAGLGLLALHGSPPRSGPGLERPEKQGAPLPAEPVMIVVVKSPAAVRTVREAIDAERIVANSLEGFAVREGWLVVSSADAAGPLLALAGWSRARLELVKPAPRDPLRPAAPGGAAAGGAPAPLDALLAKPTLTLDEALAALALLE